MNNRGRKSLIICVVLICALLLAAAAFLFVRALPEKKQQPVETLDSVLVYEDSHPTVEPEREAEYEGELPEAVEQAQNMPDEEPEQPVEPVPEQTHSAIAQKLLSQMTTEEKIWQLFFVRPEQITGVEAATVAGEMTEKALAEMPVGGIIYFARNIEDTEQLSKLLQGTQGFSKTPLFLGVDEEGGVVSRLGKAESVDITHLDAMSVYGAAGDSQKLYDDYLALAKSMRALGFTLDFAPVCDVPDGEDSTIFSRAFSTDPAICAEFAAKAAAALQDGGVAACMKHFPGYGAAAQDDHLGTVAIPRTEQELSEKDLLPFTAGIEAGAHFVMVSHLVCPNVTGDDTPSDLSFGIVTELLRNKLGFSGVIITDAQDMGSITGSYSAAEAAVKALQAGCDMILTPNGLRDAYDGVLAAVQSGELTEQRIEESVLRILDAKAALGLLTEE